jgi:hypothetical protein
MLRQVVHIARRDLGPLDRRPGARVAGVRCDEVLGEVVEDRGEAVVFV